MLPAVDAVIFDCDGVLIDSEILMTQLWVRELNALGCTFTHESYASRMLGLSDAEYLLELRAAVGRELPMDALLAIESREAKALVEVPAVPGMLALVSALNVPRCVASSSSPARLDATLGSAGFSGLFPGAVFSAAMVRHGKPAPDLFLFAADQLNVAPARCLVIEDSAHGVAGARAAGMSAVGFGGASHMFPSVRERLQQSGITHFAEDAAALAALLGVSDTIRDRT